ncbi:MAG: bifunctional folylpolyglutamate synthase/dihydrofolate synthase [Nanoarchaeota archaeon]|nr:bifunctional folylpolyglutamate synthase/dihydrofolate synthase [Nanoarchaeota archaeon]
MDHIESLNFLESLKAKGWDLSLDRMEKLLAMMGNPEEGMDYVHIAGTNGKGSVAAMLATVLHKAGYSTGLATSPHLIKINERFWVDGEHITDDELAALVSEHKDSLKGSGATYFEAVTALQFMHFKQKCVKIAVMEVGLGGRLDATNVITPLVSVITNIGLEHIGWLGDTIPEIAAEKAGIIKPRVPVVTGAEGEALQVIKRVASKMRSPVTEVRDKSVIKPGLDGEFQRKNALIVQKVIDQLKLKYPVKPETLRDGIQETRWPGRMQRINNYLLDSAHNLHAMKTVIDDFPSGAVAVVGILKDKDYKGMIHVLEKKASRFIFCEPKTERACPAELLARHCTKPHEIIKSVKKALEKAKDEKLVLVTGSCYTVGEALKVLN